MGILGKLKEKLGKKTTDDSSSLPNLDDLYSKLEDEISQSKINKQRQDFLDALRSIESAPPANTVHNESGKLQPEKAQHNPSLDLTELDQAQVKRARRHAEDPEFQRKLKQIMEEDSR